MSSVSEPPSEPKPEQNAEPNREPLDVDGILQAIRVQLLKRQEQAEQEALDFDAIARGEVATPAVRLPAALHEAVFRAAMLREDVRASPRAPTRRNPNIGRLLEHLRMRKHRIALRYVDAAAQRQIAFNVEASRALVQLVAALEAEGRDERIGQMQAEVELLRRRVAELEQRS